MGCEVSMPSVLTLPQIETALPPPGVAASIPAELFAEGLVRAVLWKTSSRRAGASSRRAGSHGRLVDAAATRPSVETKIADESGHLENKIELVSDQGRTCL